MKKLMMVFVIGLIMHTLQAGTIENTPSYIKVYQWEVVGKGIKASGTSSSLVQAKKMVKMASQGSIIESSTVTSYYVSIIELQQQKRIHKYTWSVAGKGFHASGVTLSASAARRLIKQISATSIQEFKIIEKH